MFVTKSQIYVFIACVAFGGISGIFFSFSSILKFFLKNDILKVFCDILSCLVIAFLYCEYFRFPYTGRPCARPDNSPGSPFRSRTADRKPLDRVGRHHRPLAAIGKGSCSLRLYQVPERGQQRQGVAHRRRDVAAQAGSHQNRREQKFASCSELGFRILPVVV